MDHSHRSRHLASGFDYCHAALGDIRILFGDGTDTPNGISDDTVLVQNLADINSGISMILSAGLDDVLARIDSDFTASGCDGKEVNNPFGSDVVFNANAIVSQYCAYKDTDATSISKDDMESLLAANKDKLYSFTYTDEVREVPSEPEAESTETVAPDTTTEEPPEPTYETIRVYTISYNGELILPIRSSTCQTTKSYWQASMRKTSPFCWAMVFTRA